MEIVRLNKYLASCGIAARRKCDELILSGQVSVNGIVEKKLGVKIDSDVDKVRYDGHFVSPTAKFEYVMLNKPKNVITTVSDDRKRQTVLDLVDSKNRLFPIGRLDRDTTGLMILTNDGDFAYRLSHPKYKVQKKYRVRVSRKLSDRDLATLANGISLEEGVTAPCELTRVETDEKTVDIALHQGWNRQVRRMFSTLDYEVKRLHRTEIGGLRLNLPLFGQWRRLKSYELKSIRRVIHGN